MPLTKKQVSIIDALKNGAHIWRAANTYYLARVIGENQHGNRVFQSELLPKRTFDAMVEKEIIVPCDDGKTWRLK
jgi:hypothetical protein